MKTRRALSLLILKVFWPDDIYAHWQEIDSRQTVHGGEGIFMAEALDINVVHVCCVRRRHHSDQ